MVLRKIKNQRVKNINRDITELIVHCSATPYGKDFSAATIDEWHRTNDHFQSIGYHYLVHLDGRVELGRDVSHIGAHCKNHNTFSIGICYIGGIGQDGKAADTRTAAQKVALAAILQVWKGLYPNAQIYGHRDFAAKDCPCYDARSEYKDMTGEVFSVCI